VIVRSSPDRAPAGRSARTLNADGYDARVLRSDNYSHLRPGYWVAFSGVYDTLAQAQAQAAQLNTAKHPDPDVRLVQRRRVTGRRI
jgi:hypothetical protein